MNRAEMRREDSATVGRAAPRPVRLFAGDGRRSPQTSPPALAGLTAALMCYSRAMQTDALGGVPEPLRQMRSRGKLSRCSPLRARPLPRWERRGRQAMSRRPGSRMSPRAAGRTIPTAHVPPAQRLSTPKPRLSARTVRRGNEFDPHAYRRPGNTSRQGISVGRVQNG